MILNKLFKSGKSKVIFSLVILFLCFSYLVFAVVKSALYAQIKAEDDLIRDTKTFSEFYQCLYHADGIEYQDKTYISADDYKTCVDSLISNKPKFLEYK